MIRFETIDVMTPVLDYDHVRDWIVGVAAGCGYGVGELYYYFCSDEALLDINQRRLGHDFYTDIVTFPLTDSGDVISSEFCISLDRIAENCLNFSRSFESELLRVIIHGVLHLIGYDDHTDEERSRMREKEEECLRQFYK
ncbi:MAG: rRNA maturation RNase YbeY [Bacteroidales bacterium]|nr:rRNA maturation RNase YbeY [Bacteroidales bacterium]